MQQMFPEATQPISPHHRVLTRLGTGTVDTSLSCSVCIALSFALESDIG